METRAQKIVAIEQGFDEAFYADVTFADGHTERFRDFSAIERLQAAFWRNESL